MKKTLLFVLALAVIPVGAVTIGFMMDGRLYGHIRWGCHTPAGQGRRSITHSRSTSVSISARSSKLNSSSCRG